MTGTALEPEPISTAGVDDDRLVEDVPYAKWTVVASPAGLTVPFRVAVVAPTAPAWPVVAEVPVVAEAAVVPVAVVVVAEAPVGVSAVVAAEA